MNFSAEALTECERTAVVLSLSGEVTAESAASLHADLMSAAVGEGDIAIDVTEVTYLHSAVLQLLVAAAVTLKSSGRKLLLVGVPKSMDQAIRLAGFASLLLEGESKPGSKDDILMAPLCV